MVLMSNMDIWLLKMKNTDSLYYGDLDHPFYLFSKREEAEKYAETKSINNMFYAVKATQDILNDYFSCSF